MELYQQTRDPLNYDLCTLMVGSMEVDISIRTFIPSVFFPSIALLICFDASRTVNVAYPLHPLYPLYPTR